MTTRRTLVKRLWAPLLERHPDLVAAGHWLFVRPVSHIVTFVLLDGTSSKEQFVPRWGAFELFYRRPQIGLNHGQRFWDLNNWRYGEEKSAAQLQAAVEGVLPKLRSVRSIESFEQMLPGLIFPATHTVSELRQIVFDAAWGRLDMCEEKLTSFERRRADWLARAVPDRYGRLRYPEGGWWSYADLEGEIAMLVDLLKPLVVARERRAIGDLFRSWERATCAAHKIEHIWEPAPFPMEIEVGITKVDAPP
jgi:hypothetical protein